MMWTGDLGKGGIFTKGRPSANLATVVAVVAVVKDVSWATSHREGLTSLDSGKSDLAGEETVGRSCGGNVRRRMIR